MISFLNYLQTCFFFKVVLICIVCDFLNYLVLQQTVTLKRTAYIMRYRVWRIRYLQSICITLKLQSFYVYEYTVELPYLHQPHYLLQFCYFDQFCPYCLQQLYYPCSVIATCIYTSTCASGLISFRVRSRNQVTCSKDSLKITYKFNSHTVLQTTLS